MSNLVSEKQAGLRLALRNMGMLEGAYWSSWMAFDALITLLTALLLVLFGEACSAVAHVQPVSWWCFCSACSMGQHTNSCSCSCEQVCV
jgi:hypothetical protein